jgi:hypothetical protein
MSELHALPAVVAWQVWVISIPEVPKVQIAPETHDPISTQAAPMATFAVMHLPVELEQYRPIEQGPSI